jgi:hypothetical protein
MWVSDEPLSDLTTAWLALSGAFATTGLWPIVVCELRNDDRPEPFDTPDALRASSFLAAEWAESYFPAGELEHDDAHPLEPFSSNPPPLASPATRFDQRAPGRVLDALGSQRLALVPTTRPADTVAHIGWSGAVNHTDDVAGLASVLRSWEDRFGAMVVGMTSDVLVLAVQGPPMTIDDALPIAAEHYAFCPDTVDQGVGTIRALAEELTASIRWRFWWD